LAACLFPQNLGQSGSSRMAVSDVEVSPASSAHSTPSRNAVAFAGAAAAATVNGNGGLGNGIGGAGAGAILELSPEEEKSVQRFLAHVNGWRTARGYAALTHSSAVKFLMARKFNVDRALTLFRQHEMMRVREGLDVIDPTSMPLRKELETRKFTVLATRDPHGAALALFNARAHDPSVTTHKTTLQGVIHQLDIALEDTQTQRSGLIFVYNMYGSKYSNFDYDLSQKMLTLLKGCYPARLKKVLIVTAPLWFRAPFKVLRLFVREKLRDRVYTVSIPQLVQHVPAANLPKELGGTHDHDHAAWLAKCKQVSASRQGQLVTLSCSQPSSPVKSHPQLDNRPTLEQLESLPVVLCSNGDERSRKTDTNQAEASLLPPPPPPPPPEPPENEDECHIQQEEEETSGAASVANANGGGAGENVSVRSSEDEEDDYVGEGLSLADFIEHVRVKGRQGLMEEYSEIRCRPPSGTFNEARSPKNQAKNRYTDVLCYDHSRVPLAHNNDHGDHGDDDDDGGFAASAAETDYINANFVDGYKQKNAFIFTQGPLPKTFKDFWQMVWEQRVQVVVMTTRTFERGRQKCGQYWPTDVGVAQPTVAGDFRVTATEVSGGESSGDGESADDYVVTRLTLRNEKTGETRPVVHFQFVCWPDYGVPDSALSMLTFLQRVRSTQKEMTSQLSLSGEWNGHELGPPIVVHCSAGIGRTGTFATLDISIRKFEAEGKVDIRSTVEVIRSQRAYSIQMPDQYVFCHLAFLEYALNLDYVDEIDLTGFDDGLDSDYN